MGAFDLTSLRIYVILLTSSLVCPSFATFVPSYDWDKEIVKSIQEVYRPLNLPGGQFLDKVGFHHTGVIVTTERNEEVLVHSQPGKAVQVTVMSLATGPNHKSMWKAKTTVLEAKPGITVSDAVRAATNGGSYRILHNNCNDVSARIVETIQGSTEAPSWRRRRRRRRARKAL